MRLQDRLQVYKRKITEVGTKSTLEEMKEAKYELKKDDSITNSASQLHISSDPKVLFIKDGNNTMHRLEFDFEGLKFSNTHKETYQQGNLTFYKGINSKKILFLFFKLQENDEVKSFFKVVNMDDLKETARLGYFETSLHFLGTGVCP